MAAERRNDETEAERHSRPPWIETEAQIERWRLCRAIAEQMCEEDAAGAWHATRALYQSDLPT